MLTRLAMWWLRRQIHNDDGYAIAWHANLACCAQDEGLAWRPAQFAAARFMHLVFDRDTTKLPQLAADMKLDKGI
jgi:hypothetical protein